MSLEIGGILAVLITLCITFIIWLFVRGNRLHLLFSFFFIVIVGAILNTESSDFQIQCGFGVKNLKAKADLTQCIGLRFQVRSEVKLPLKSANQQVQWLPSRCEGFNVAEDVNIASAIKNAWAQRSFLAKLKGVFVRPSLEVRFNTANPGDVPYLSSEERDELAFFASETAANFTASGLSDDEVISREMKLSPLFVSMPAKFIKGKIPSQPSFVRVSLDVPDGVSAPKSLSLDCAFAPRCISNISCGGGSCVNNHCESPCAIDDECGIGDICYENVCRKKCSISTDCVGGGRCVSTVCMPNATPWDATVKVEMSTAESSESVKMIGSIDLQKVLPRTPRDGKEKYTRLFPDRGMPFSCAGQVWGKTYFAETTLPVADGFVGERVTQKGVRTPWRSLRDARKKNKNNNYNYSTVFQNLAEDYSGSIAWFDKTYSPLKKGITSWRGTITTIVLQDFSAEEIESACSDLGDALQQGATIIVAGRPPTLKPKCDWYQARPKTIGRKPVWVDLRARIFINFDASSFSTISTGPTDGLEKNLSILSPQKSYGKRAEAARKEVAGGNFGTTCLFKGISSLTSKIREKCNRVVVEVPTRKPQKQLCSDSWPQLLMTACDGTVKSLEKTIQDSRSADASLGHRIGPNDFFVVMEWARGEGMKLEKSIGDALQRGATVIFVPLKPFKGYDVRLSANKPWWPRTLPNVFKVAKLRKNIFVLKEKKGEELQIDSWIKSGGTPCVLGATCTGESLKNTIQQFIQKRLNKQRTLVEFKYHGRGIRSLPNAVRPTYPQGAPKTFYIFESFNKRGAIGHIASAIRVDGAGKERGDKIHLLTVDEAGSGRVIYAPFNISLTSEQDLERRVEKTPCAECSTYAFSAKAFPMNKHGASQVGSTAILDFASLHVGLKGEIATPLRTQAFNISSFKEQVDVLVEVPVRVDTSANLPEIRAMAFPFENTGEDFVEKKCQGIFDRGNKSRKVDGRLVDVSLGQGATYRFTFARLKNLCVGAECDLLFCARHLVRKPPIVAVGAIRLPRISPRVPLESGSGDIREIVAYTASNHLNSERVVLTNILKLILFSMLFLRILASLRPWLQSLRRAKSGNSTQLDPAVLVNADGRIPERRTQDSAAGPVHAVATREVGQTLKGALATDLLVLTGVIENLQVVNPRILWRKLEQQKKCCVFLDDTLSMTGGQERQTLKFKFSIAVTKLMYQLTKRIGYDSVIWVYSKGVVTYDELSELKAPLKEVGVLPDSSTGEVFFISDLLFMDQMEHELLSRMNALRAEELVFSIVIIEDDRDYKATGVGRSGQHLLDRTGFTKSELVLLAKQRREKIIICAKEQGGRLVEVHVGDPLDEVLDLLLDSQITGDITI